MDLEPSLTANLFSNELDISEGNEDYTADRELTLPDKEVMDFFLGFVVHKYMSKYPQLGTVLKECNNLSIWDAFINKNQTKN